MAWSSESAATPLTTISDTPQTFDLKPTLNPRERAQVEIEVDFAGTTDDALIKVYASGDGTNYGTSPFYQQVIDKDNADPGRLFFWVEGVYQFQVTVESTGATDDHTSADMVVRTDGVNAT